MYISELSTQAPEAPESALEKKVYQELEALHIPFTRVDNDPVEAMEECREISERLGAEIRKTIMLCNRKKTLFYLVILPAEKHFDTKTFCEKLGVSRVSFAPADYMETMLGVSPGSATVMAVLNDLNRTIQVVIDRAVADEEWFSCNPGVNTAHIKFKTEDLLKVFLPKVNHKALIAKL